ncbi:MAG: hypothetical protein IJR36_06045 [Lachnospiraceae bacterium]|nr:hypothetical protein [Lachnospiraceae bacterium]MBQ9593413.1 hypothetical protein [Lachnospiraceae bacterium]
MLTKIMKYESKAMSRVLLPFYAALLASSLLSGLLLMFNRVRVDASDGMHVEISAADSIVSTLTIIFIFAFAVLVASISIATLIAIIQRFNKGCLGDEGYLTFTLPVGIDTQLWARVLVSFFWTLLSLIVTGLCVFLMVILTVGNLDFLSEIGDVVREIFQNPNAPIILTELGVLSLLSLLVAPLGVYFCMSLGQIITPKHRIVGAFIVYFGMSFVAQILTSIFGTVTIQDQTLLDYLFTVRFEDFFHGFFLFNIATLILSGIVFYFVTRFLLSRKLNLE